MCIFLQIFSLNSQLSSRDDRQTFCLLGLHNTVCPISYILNKYHFTIEWILNKNRLIQANWQFQIQFNETQNISGNDVVNEQSQSGTPHYNLNLHFLFFWWGNYYSILLMPCFLPFDMIVMTLVSLCSVIYSAFSSKILVKLRQSFVLSCLSCRPFSCLSWQKTSWPKVFWK